MLTQLKASLAEEISRLFKPLLPKEVIDTGFAEPNQIAGLLESPRRPEHGQISFPMFSLTKAWIKAFGAKPGEPPPVWTERLREAFNQELVQEGSDLMGRSGVRAVSSVAGFLNFQLQPEYLARHLFTAVHEARVSGQKLGSSEKGKGRKVVIDYSSPNVAKPMHVGHLRATVIGQAIRNLAVTQGYEVIGLNHLGDWGVQFGKLAWAIKEWGHEYDFKSRPFESLYEIYVRFHREEESNPDLSKMGSQAFKSLEDGDPETRKLWAECVDISMKEYEKVWARLGVKHDLVRGESFYNDRLQGVIDLLNEKKLLVRSEGADVVMLGENEPPCLIRKSDGASLYATRDLASALYRMQELKADLNLYIVGSDQNLHFKQVFAVLERAGFDWADKMHHISFGMYRFKEGKMSTRKGQTVFLADVLNQAVEQTRKLIEAKNPALSADEKADIAEKVGVGAVVFNDLAVDRVQNVEFDWDKILSFEGDSGPYVQYMYVRCASLLRKANGFHLSLDEQQLQASCAVLNGEDEIQLLMALLSFDEVLKQAFEAFKPNTVAQYLLQVCGLFSQFYHKHRILDSEPHEQWARLALADCTREVIKTGLEILSIQAPEVM